MELKTQLLERLGYVNATREARSRLAGEVLQQPDWLGPLLEIGLEREDELGHRACWVVEFACKTNLELVYPCLDLFTAGLAGLQKESAIRPMAKICELLAEATLNKNPDKRPPFSPVHREHIIAACFDWLIGPHKVAPKAHSMTTLYILGQKNPWVHQELRAVLERQYARGSAGYRARARRVLGLLEERT